MKIRHERAEDFAAIRRLLIEAFGGPAEAKLVDGLRDDGDLALALIAEEVGGVVGYVAFSPLKSPERALALAPVAVAPVAVAPERQRRGIGTALIDEGLRQARAGGWGAVFVLGEPVYYGRFGFTPQAAAEFDCLYAGPYFMALHLSDVPIGAAPVIYSERFAAA